MGNAKYIYAVASIRSREKNLLSDADVETMAGLKDSAAVVTYLRDRGWGQNTDAGRPEDMLSAEEDLTNGILSGLSIDPSVIDTLSYREKFHNLKTAVKEVCTGTEDEAAFYADSQLPPEKLREAVRENQFDRLPEDMRRAAKDAKDVMLTARDGQRCDVIIDRACLEAMEKSAKKSGDAFLIQYTEQQIAVTDIKIAVRMSGMKKSLAAIEEALAPCRDLDSRELAVAAAAGTEQLYEYLGRKGYGDAADAIRVSFSAFERWCDNQVMDMMIPQKKKIDSSGPVIAFYLARKNEIQMARIIITAKENGFPEDAIRQRLRKMYG